MRISWGTATTLVYSTFALGTIGMVTFAVGHPVDLVGADYYAQSTAYDLRIAAIERADAFGNEVAIAADAEQRLLHVRLPGAHASQARGEVTLYRPSDAGSDRRWPLEPGGVTSVPVAGLEAGIWRVRVEWTSGGQSFYREQVLRLR